MRTLLLLIMYGLLFSGRAQTVFNRAYHDRSEVPLKLTETAEAYYFLSRRSDFTIGGWLYKHDKSGNLKFKIAPPAGRVDGLIQTADGKLLCFGIRDSICDVPPQTQKNILIRIDTNGTVQSSGVRARAIQDNYRCVIQRSDLFFLAFADSVIDVYDPAAQFTATLNPGLNSFRTALRLGDGNILLSANSGSVPCLLKMTPGGVPVSSVSTAILFEKLVPYGNGQILALGANGYIYKYSAVLQALGNSPMNTSQKYRDIAVINDTVYSILANPQAYRVCDTSFATISYTVCNLQDLEQISLSVNSQNAAVLSDCRANVSPQLWSNHRFSALNVFPRLNGNLFRQDLAVTNLTPDSTYLSCGAYCNFKMRPRVTVKNTGSLTANSFYLNYFVSPGITGCNKSYYQEKFQQLVAPGDSLTVITSSFVSKMMGPPRQGTYSLSFCFYVSLPDGETDKMLTNNEICKTFTAASIPENMHAVAEPKIYPVPANEHLEISSTQVMTGLRVYNMIGALVMERADQGNTFLINTSALPPGMYLLQCSSVRGIIRRKIVVQH